MAWLSYCCTQGEGCCNYDVIFILLLTGKGMLQLWHDYHTFARSERDATFMAWLSYCSTQVEGCCNYDMTIILPHAGRGMMQLWHDYHTVAHRRGMLQFWNNDHTFARLERMLQLWHDYQSVARRERDAAIMTRLSYCRTQGEGCCSYEMIAILLHEGREMLQL